jgi:hypothetical protein
MRQPAPSLLSSERAKPVRIDRADLPFKRRKPLAERIDASILLLERINLALLRCQLPIFGL